MSGSACWLVTGRYWVMTEEIPAFERDEQAAPLAGTVTAAVVGVGNADNGGGPEEGDEYDELLASLGRTEEEDERIAVHEAGHAVAGRLLGHPLGGATVDPGPGYEGRIWGERYVEAFTQGRGDASDVRGALAPMMPKAGEDRAPGADTLGQVHPHCLEVLRGLGGEFLLLGAAPPPADDLRQARELAMLI